MFRSINNEILTKIETFLPLLPLLARGLFATSLLVYFWTAGVNKLGPGAFGFLHPAPGAYIQILSKSMQLVNYDPDQLSTWLRTVLLVGTWAEFILPALIILGLTTCLAALGMVGFISLQSLTDLYGHGGLAQPKTLGVWFDKFPDGIIFDQRAFWLFTLLFLLLKSGGAVPLDRILGVK